MGLAVEASPYARMFNSTAPPPPPPSLVLKSQPHLLDVFDNHPGFTRFLDLYHRGAEHGRPGPCYMDAMGNAAFDWAGFHLKPAPDDEWFQTVGQDGLMVSSPLIPLALSGHTPNCRQWVTKRGVVC